MWRIKTIPPAAFHRVGDNSMEGVKDIQGGDVRAGAPGLHGGWYEHSGGGAGVRTAPGHGAQDAEVLGASRVSSKIAAAPAQAGPVPGCDRPDTGGGPQSSEEAATHRQAHLRALRDEHEFPGKYTIVKDYVRERRLRTREMYVPLSHAPGHAQCDFGQAKAVIGGVERTVHYFVLELPHSDVRFVKAYPAETTEAFCDGHISAFSLLGGVPMNIPGLRRGRLCTTTRSWRWPGSWETVEGSVPACSRSSCRTICSRTAMMNTGPPRPGSDPFEDWRDAFNLICRLESRWRRKCLWHGVIDVNCDDTFRAIRDWI